MAILYAIAASGSGAGTHAEVYPIYYSNELCEADTEFTHAENSYLQIGLEAGYPGLALVVAAVVSALVTWWSGTPNSLDGNRDMYLVRSEDGGRTFGPPEKLGAGTWKLAACPMDGGDLVRGGGGPANRG